jgi:4-aminobutyrate aminotransferase-like enzyme
VLADEVQAGFGRVGPSMWAFVEGGLRPDIVTLGKPMGNGHPVAAVVTRSDVIAPIARRYAYFSTFAGSPVSAVAALATLDVIAARRLAEQAPVTGRYLREQIGRVAAATPWLGDVRGRGLIAGLDVVPGAAAGVAPGVTAPRLAERLRDLGVLVGATGPGRHVLKVRPPLVWERQHADLFVDALRRAAADLGPNGG